MAKHLFVHMKKTKKSKNRNIAAIPPRLFTRFTIFGILITGLLTFLIHPTIIDGYRLFQPDFLVWIYLAPVILCVVKSEYSFKRKFIIICLSGVLGNYGLLFWLIPAMTSFGGLNFLTSFGVLTALVVVLSFVFAACLSLALWVHKKSSIPFFILIPVFLVIRDVILHYFPFGGYPWGIPPYSQGSWLSSFQWLDVTGVFGLSFFIYLINGLFVDALSAWLKSKTFNRQVIYPLSVIVVLFFLSFGLSHLSHSRFQKDKKLIDTIRLAIVQANVPQDIKWDPVKAKNIVKRYAQLTSRAMKRGPELVLWPETAFPFILNLDKNATRKFLNRDSFEAPIFFGAFSSQSENSREKQYNTIFHVDTSALIVDHYHKIHLVPFGEYIPFRRYLHFLDSLTQGFGNVDRGSSYPLFNVKGIRFASLNCIEDVFPRYAQRFTNIGADVLVNYTNDAWYGDNSAQYAHVVYSQIRALENRRPLIRATNTGVTAIINATGQVTHQLRPFQEKILINDLKIETGSSFFAKHGHWWWMGGIVLLGVGFVLFALFRGSQRRKQ